MRIQRQRASVEAARLGVAVKTGGDPAAVEELQCVFRPEPQRAVRIAERFAAVPVPRQSPAEDVVAEDARSAGVAFARQLERMRQGGAQFAVFISSTFWWLDHYKQFQQHLRSHYSCVREDEQVIAFDLRHALS